MTCKDCCHYVPCFSGGKSIWGEVEQTEDDHCPHFADSSRFIELPCKVGDIVYQIGASANGIKIYEAKIKRIIYCTDSIDFDERTIGNSVFLTRAEAEKALKEREQK